MRWRPVARVFLRSEEGAVRRDSPGEAVRMTRGPGRQWEICTVGRHNLRRFEFQPQPDDPMNFVLQSHDRALISVAAEELLAITNALNEVCNGTSIPSSEFRTRLGVSRDLVVNLLKSVSAVPHTSRQCQEAIQAWADQGSVMVRAITVFGDPVELGETEAAEFAEQLQQAINEAS